MTRAYRRWSWKEEDLAMDLWLNKHMSAFQIGIKMGRDGDAVRQKILRLRQAGRLKDEGRAPAHWLPMGGYPNRYRAVCALVKAGLTTDEIADQLGTDRAAVSATRGVLALRGEL